MKRPKKDFRRVVFSDESWVTTAETGCRTQWAKSREKVRPVERRARVNVASVQIWAAIGYNYRSELIIFPTRKVDEEGNPKGFRLNAAGYRRRCLAKVVPDLAKENALFQQDGARCHQAVSTLKYLADKGVDVLKWPPYSPDLSPIESLWKDLKAAISKKYAKNLAELRKHAQTSWKSLPQSLINRHVMSFQGRLKRFAQQS